MGGETGGGQWDRWGTGGRVGNRWGDEWGDGRGNRWRTVGQVGDRGTGGLTGEWDNMRCECDGRSDHNVCFYVFTLLHSFM